MKLNHLNLIVTDVAAAILLFEGVLGFRCTDVKGDNAMAILEGEDTFTLVLMKGKETDPVYPVNFHIGFMQSTEAAVWEVYHKLESSGVVSGSEPRKIRDGFGFYFTFQNLMIEVGTT